MIPSLTKGISFGITSSVITTLGIIVGMHAGTDLKHGIIVAILIIASADSLADACGIHFSEQARGASHHECFVASVSTFVGKLFFALSFLVPILLFETHRAIVIDIIYGLIVLTIQGFLVAKAHRRNASLIVFFQVFLAIAIISFSHFIGTAINKKFPAPF